MSPFQNAFPQTSRSRRDLLKVGGLSLFGLRQWQLEQLRAVQASDSPSQKHRRNTCVFLFLFGGPSQIDLWDMKPKAPAQIRGDFTPTNTCVPGIDICEHLPMLGQSMDKICLMRSTTHRMNVHGPACSEVFSGREYFGPPTTDQALPEDWPSLSSLVMRYGESFGGLPPSGVLPWYLQFPGQSRKIAGQSGGRMGERFNAFLLDGDIGRSDFQVEGVKLPPDIPMDRFQRRKYLLDLIDARTPVGETPISFDTNSKNVFELLENRASDVFEIEREPTSVRERYGSTAVGQSLLMARRLVESGVSLVTVNWQDETKTDGVNTCWDTHQNNFSKLTDLLCPIFDRAYTAFIEDLHDRGLLETTLVVACGEFGRTPKMGQFTQSSNTQKTGRDHWPNAFTTLLAGGGVQGGQVYGSTTPDGGYVLDKPVSPADLTATIMHHLGIDYRQEYEDEFQRVPRKLSVGYEVKNLG
ncbi:MAG: DUF1501 domain-containing protein [Planctomycetota bacterium]|nr:DUF1501 domain-containing protein [Planctomycetota bacterium]